MITELQNHISKLLPELNSIRRKLHTYPEIAFKEYETTKFIRNIVESWGLKFYPFQHLETGGYCDVGEGDIYLFRSDIDALAIQENSNHHICSKNEGVMHACGHDFHTTIGLGILKYFKSFSQKLNGKIRVIFQPGEEAAPGGAEEVVKENIWDNAKGILTMHVDPQTEAGKIILLQGAVQASSTSIFIEISGPGGHTSKPHETVNLINIASHYIVQLQNHIQQKTDPRNTVVLSFGYIAGGETHNVIPRTIQLRGTLRTHDNMVLQNSKDLLMDFTNSFEKLCGVKIKFKFPTSCPATINDKNLSKMFIKFMEDMGKKKEVLLPLKPSIGADDFSFYLNKVPGLYLGIGGAGSGILHSGDLELNEDLLEPAIQYMTGFIMYLFSYKK